MTDSQRDPTTPEFLAKLGLAPPYSVEDVKEAYRAKVKTAHPDVGGSAAEFGQIQEAYEQALEYVRFRANRMTWLSSHVEQYAVQQEFIAEIERQGGAAEIEPVDWLKKSFGADFAQLVSRVVGLRLSNQQFGDDTIAHLLSERQMFDNLHWLDLSGSRITDRGAALLVSFRRLRQLDLRGTTVGEPSAELVGLLPHLTWVGLPPGAVGRLGRLALRWRRPELRWAREGEVCGSPATASSGN
ncbi:MAG TPA: hypothetical protein VHY91_00605 [Pirellulales bacterium]|jgi:hypothetical protein|nr:hypothetical protein [Pirellulales bacterium]